MQNCNAKLKSYQYFFCIICLLLNSSQSVFAKIEVNNYPSKIEINKEFEIDVVLSNLTDPTHFLSIALHKNSGDPYFGQTQKGDNWIEADDSNCKSFPGVTISEGSWSGKLKGKINYNEKDFDNSLGNYILKVFKYTDSCNKSDSNDLTVELFDSNPPLTATPVPTNTPGPTSVPTSTPTNTSVPTANSKSQNSPTVYMSPTIKQTVPTITYIKSNNNLVASENASSGAFLGETSDPTVTVEEEKHSSAASSAKNSFPIFAFLIGSGVVLIGTAAVLSARQIKNNQKENKS